MAQSTAWTWTLLFFLKQKDKHEMVKCKLCPGQKQLHDPANTTSHRQPAQMAF